MAVLLAATMIVAGCSSSNLPPSETPTQEEGTATARFSISSGDVLQPSSTSGASTARTLSALAFSMADVTQIRVDVWEKDKQDKPLYINFDLNKEAGPWEGSIPFLPKNKELTFFATAYKAGGVALFSGATHQTLTGNTDTVLITLKPVNDGDTVTLNRIRRVMIPSEFLSTQSGNISFVVEATTGEELTYSITKGQDVPGSFLPESGTITLVGTVGTFVSQYTAPSVTEVKEFEYTFTLTNAKGHSVSTTFKTKVKPPGDTNGVDATINVHFNPVINGLNARRVLGTNTIILTANVADDDLPTTPLTYDWSFTPPSNTTYDPAPVFTNKDDNQINFENYTIKVQGMVNLAVTDSHGGTTTLKYPIIPGQYIDNLIEVALPTGINTIRGGENHTCALLNNGDLRCWGHNLYGQLGYGDQITTGAGNTSSPYPYSRPEVPLVGKGARLAVGANHTCALYAESGFVHCWGRNDYGQLGYNLGIPSSPNATNVADGEALSKYGYVYLAGTAVKIAAGYAHTCALMKTGNVRCWGLNNYGQLGYGNKNNIGDDEAPWKAGDVNVGGPVRDIAVGGYHTCALLETGEVRCWGLNANGQLGLGTISAPNDMIGDNEHPSSKPVVNVGGSVLQLSAGMSHTCALLSTGNMRCWGYNGYGQLGYGNYSYSNPNWPYNSANNDIGDNEPPTSAGTVDVGGKVLQIAADDGHTCALLATGDIKCWGRNDSGQLGLGNTEQKNQPTTSVNLDGNSAYQVTTGGQFSCALLANGNARCWGRNAHGQLGLGNTTPISLPTSDVLLFPPKP
jgi:alpha-tubulin suppressor-like RCC1 family protein